MIYSDIYRKAAEEDAFEEEESTVPPEQDSLAFPTALLQNMNIFTLKNKMKPIQDFAFKTD